MLPNLKKYAEKIVWNLLRLQDGEDLSINSENGYLYFAHLVKEEALKATHRPVTFVITRGGRPSAVAPYEPEDYTLPQSRGHVMLHLEHRTRPDQSFSDFESAAEDMGAMLRFGHLAEPIYLDRRIAVPWCSVPVFAEQDEENWNALLSSFLFSSPDISAQHLLRCQTLNRFGIRKLRLTGEKTDLELELDSGSQFIDNFITLSNSRSFFSGINTDLMKTNLKRLNCNGKAEVEALILGNALDSVVTFQDGILVTNPMDYSQRILKRFFLLEDNLDCLSILTIGEKGVCLSLGCNLLDSLKSIPKDEDHLPDGFVQTVFKLDLNLKCDKIQAFTPEGEILLMNHGTLLL